MPASGRRRRVVLTWELGGGLGHLARLRLFARHLVAAGHECIAAVPRPDVARDFFGATVQVVQAPRRAAPPRNIVDPQLSYATLLHNVGFDDPAALATRIRGWRALLHDVSPDAVVSDHSPFALIAARSIGLPALHVGTGFTVPPITEPFPSFQPDMVVPDDMLMHNEAVVHASLSHALTLLDLEPFERLQDIFTGTARGVLDYPELDPYDGVRREPPLGVPSSSEGEAPEWPAHEGPRVFVYLRGPSAAPDVFEALRRTRASVLAAVGQASLSEFTRFERPGLVVTDRLIDLREAAATCDAFVSHASHGFMTEMLLAGKPGVLLPRFHEQLLLAKRVASLGAGIVPATRRHSDIEASIGCVVDDDAFRRAAERFAARWSSRPRQLVIGELVHAFLARGSGLGG